MDQPQLHDVGNGHDPGLRLWTGPLPPVDTFLPTHLTLTCRGRLHHHQKGGEEGPQQGQEENQDLESLQRLQQEEREG
eukprot:XP_006257196.2 PREDICTED: uncharacterized protein LOC501389 isoform X2 [Rattus norvegicus]